MVIVGRSWSCVVGGVHFRSKIVDSHRISHKDATLGVGRVVCIPLVFWVPICTSLDLHQKVKIGSLHRD